MNNFNLQPKDGESYFELLSRVQREEAQAQQARQEAARVQPAPIPQSAQDRAFLEAANLYQSIMDAEAQKTAETREAEGASVRLEQLSAQLEAMQINPSAHQNIQQVQAEFDSTYRRLQELGAAKEDVSFRSSAPKTLYFFDGKAILE